jgi:hypothetical protein
MPRNRVAILLVLLMVSVAAMPILAAAGAIHCHDQEPSNHMAKSGFCCTDHTFTILENPALIIQESPSSFQPVQFISPTYLFVAEIFQPPRS